MARLQGIETYLHDLLKVDQFSDYCPNGVQVRGRKPVSKIMTGVSASLDLIQKAVHWQADLLLVHHGIFWDKDSRVVQGAIKKRMKYLLKNNLTLMAYHLPLDAHPKWGNNAQILKILDMKKMAPFGHYRGQTISYLGATARGESVRTFAKRVTSAFGGKPLVLPFGPKKINKVAVCSGGAPELIQEAHTLGADLFLTGEATEHVYHFAREEGIHFIAAGHHRTEILGIKNLGDHLARRFDISHYFCNIPNPI